MDLRVLNKPLPSVKNRREFQASKIFRVESMDLTFSNGTQATYERLLGGHGAVMAVPFDGSNFYMTVEYGGGVMQYQLGLVKGKIDKGESPETAVVRELSEEIGFGARKVTLLKHEMTVAPGMLSLKMFPFLCEELYAIECTSGDEPEPIDLVKLSPNEVKDLMFDPQSPLTEGRAIAALSMALRRLGYL